MADLPTEAWTKDSAAVCKALNVNPDKGLSKAQVEANLEKHGHNELPEEECKQGRW